MGGVIVERHFFCFICPYLLTGVSRCGKNPHLITVEQGYHISYVMGHMQQQNILKSNSIQGSGQVILLWT